MNNYYIPQKQKENILHSEEEERIRQLKMQAAEYEKQQRQNIKTIQGEYSDFLSVQMREKERIMNMINQEKKSYHEDIKMKHQLLKEKEQRQKMEQMQNKMAYRGLLNEQEKFRVANPERALKVTESPSREGRVSREHQNRMNQAPSQRQAVGPQRSLHHYPSSSSMKSNVVAAQNVEPVGPINANIGHKSNYRQPNPILTPISDPLYNPYIRREVTNSLHDPKKKSIYIPPDSFSF